MSLSQVAKICNMSIATVSRVINTPEKVQLETVELVERAMRRVNYRGKNNDYQFITSENANRLNIAFFVPDISKLAMQTALAVQLFDGVAEVCFKEHQELFLCRLHDINEPAFFENRLPSGIIYKNATSMDFHNMYKSIPQVICMENNLSSDLFDMVMPDNMAMGEKVLEYCKLKKHQNILILVEGNDVPFQRRSLGIRNVLQYSDIAFRELIWNPKSNSFSGLNDEIKNVSLVVFIGRDESAIRLFIQIAQSGTKWLNTVDYLPIIANAESAAIMDNHLNFISYNAWEIGKTAAEIMLLRLRSVNDKKIRTLVQVELSSGNS